MERRKIISATVIIFVTGLVLVFPKIADRFERYLEKRERQNVVIPPAKELNIVRIKPVSSASSKFSSSDPSSDKNTSAVNWNVPFTSQAPLQIWDELHEEACEEASVLMVLKYFRGEKFISPEEADREIKALVEKNSALGFPVDDTALQVMTLIRSEAPDLTLDLIRNPDRERLERELLGGALIIVPAAGRELDNPYFQRPGPDYHMLVLRGFTLAGYAIMNDPGTRRGEQFVYTWERLLEAMHDWNVGDVENGAQVAIVVKGN